MIPQRIQRKRTKGWRISPNTVSVTRPGRYGNPFRIGGWFMIGLGQGHPGMTWCEALEEKYADSRFTKVQDAAHAVEFFRIYVSRYPRKEEAEELRGKNVACWCREDSLFCHGDVWLELANAPVSS